MSRVRRGSVDGGLTHIWSIYESSCLGRKSEKHCLPIKLSFLCSSTKKRNEMRKKRKKEQIAYNTLSWAVMESCWLVAVTRRPPAPDDAPTRANELWVVSHEYWLNGSPFTCHQYHPKKKKPSTWNKDNNKRKKKKKISWYEFFFFFFLRGGEGNLPIYIILPWKLDLEAGHECIWAVHYGLPCTPRSVNLSHNYDLPNKSPPPE